MKNLKRFNEGMYADLSPKAIPIVLDYQKFLTDNEQIKKSFIDDLHAKEISKRRMVQSELDNLHKSYINVIKEVMVDVEDFLEEERELYMLILKMCLKFYYECKASDYDKFLTLQDKLDDILGSESYDICYNTYYEINDVSKYATGSFLKNNDDDIVELNSDNLKEILSKRPDGNLSVTFLFKALGYK